MPSAAHVRRPLVFLAAAVAALAPVVAVFALPRSGQDANVELTRAAIVTPAPNDDVITASAAGTTPSGTDSSPNEPSDAADTPPTSDPALTIPSPTPPPTTAPPAAPPAPPSPPSPPPASSSAPAAAPSPAPAPAPVMATSSTRDPGCESSMTEWVNQTRAANGLPSLVSDGHIHPIALRWTDTMAQRQDLAHNLRFGDEIFAARPQAVTAGENVGRGTGSDRSLYDAFMASPGHRSKILGAEFSHATVACTVDAGGQTWTTMNFWG